MEEVGVEGVEGVERVKGVVDGGVLLVSANSLSSLC